jgi:hypothetical protein
MSSISGQAPSPLSHTLPTSFHSAAAGAPTARSAATASVAGLHVLLAEDSEIVQKGLSFFLLVRLYFIIYLTTELLLSLWNAQ